MSILFIPFKFGLLWVRGRLAIIMAAAKRFGVFWERYLRWTFFMLLCLVACNMCIVRSCVHFRHDTSTGME